MTDNHRTRWEFEEGTQFQTCKKQVVQEVQDTLTIVGLDRAALARRMNVQASAITQSLALDRGLQLTTLVRIAEALDCDIEVNFIRRYREEPTSGRL